MRSIRLIKVRVIALLTLAILGIVIPAQAQDKGGLIAWWAMDEPYGVRYDSHGSHHLTDNNSVLSSTGIQNGAAMFNSSNGEYLSYHGDSNSVSGDFTTVMWVKFSNLSGECLLLEYGGWGTSVEGDSMYVDGTDSSLSIPPTLSLYTWYFIAISHDPPTGTLYLNNMATSGLFTVTHGTNMYIGSGCTARIDGVAIWDRALSGAEIAGIYNDGAGIAYTDLQEPSSHIAYLPLVAHNATPGEDDWDWGDDDDDDNIIIDYEDDTSWWEWANIIGDSASPVFGWLSEVKIEINALREDTDSMEFDPTQLDPYHMSTLSNRAGEDALDISTPSLAEQAASMGHAMGTPFGWIRAANQYLRDLNAWWMIALTTWMLGAMGWIAFVYTVSISVKLILWFIDLIIAVYHLIPVIG